jgi:hypothetical protein
MAAPRCAAQFSLNAHFAYENRDRRLTASNQTESAITEF